MAHTNVSQRVKLMMHVLILHSQKPFSSRAGPFNQLRLKASSPCYSSVSPKHSGCTSLPQHLTLFDAFYFNYPLHACAPSWRTTSKFYPSLSLQRLYLGWHPSDYVRWSCLVIFLLGKNITQTTQEDSIMCKRRHFYKLYPGK